MPKAKKFDQAASRQAKDDFLRGITAGKSDHEALIFAGRGRKTLEYWLSTDTVFKRMYDAIRHEKIILFEGDFEEFTRVLGLPLQDHMRPWEEAVSDPSVQTVLILVPPNHAKSTWGTMRMAWQLARNRSFRGCFVSSSQGYARKLVRLSGMFLTDTRQFPEMANYQPFKQAGDAWRQEYLYVVGADKSSHSPSLEAKGAGSQIYGDRFHEIVVDDIADLQHNSPADRERIKDYLRREVLSRVPDDTGKVIVIGTRVGAPDAYTELESDGFFDAVIKQPAIDQAGQPLWPTRWPLEALERRKLKVGPHQWAIVYQQAPADDEAAPFPLHLLDESKDHQRSIRSSRDLVAKRGLKKVAGFDPSLAGWAVFVVLGVDTRTQERFVLDIIREREVGSRIKEFFLTCLSEWKPSRCVVEVNNYQQFVVQDSDVVSKARTEYGCYLQPHTTSINKYDPDFGVMSLPDLFLRGLFSVPWGDQGTRDRMRGFLEELNSWRPYDKRLIQDQVMAFWFADIAARRLMQVSRAPIKIHPTTGRGAMPLRLSRQVWDVVEEEVPA